MHRQWGPGNRQFEVRCGSPRRFSVLMLYAFKDMLDRRVKISKNWECIPLQWKFYPSVCWTFSGSYPSQSSNISQIFPPDSFLGHTDWQNSRLGRNLIWRALLTTSELTCWTYRMCQWPWFCAIWKRHLVDCCDGVESRTSTWVYWGFLRARRPLTVET